jgi:acetylcholinesterase
VGEDCLSLNIQQPSPATAASKFPVLIWIYGRAFNTRSTQFSDFANFVAVSVTPDHHILVVHIASQNST